MDEPAPTATRANSRRTLLAVGLAVAAIAIAVVWVRRQLADPSVFFLSPENGAQWIRVRERLNVAARPGTKTKAGYRVRFDVRDVPDRAVLTVRAFRDVTVVLDGKELRPFANDVDAWKQPIEIDLAPHLKRGRHELFLGAANVNAHPLVLAHCDALGLKSGDTWKSSADGEKWDSALPVDEYWPAKVSRDKPPVHELVAGIWPWLALAFAGAFAWTIARARGHFASIALTPSRLRWALLLAWTVLGVNDLFRIPEMVGFDINYHLDYVRYLVEQHALPYANEGWQMFQAPLTYIVCAPLWAIFDGAKSLPIEKLLRVVPLACGALQIEIAYRFLRTVFAQRDDLQRLGVWIAGLLPMNLYMSQVLGNEPVAGVATAWTLLLCVRRLCADRETGATGGVGWLGLALGLALLSKATGVLLVPLVAWAVAWSARSRGAPIAKAATSALSVLAVAALVGGWFYARNYLKFGQAIIGGWDPLLGIPWWQDPSYRISDHFTRFGEVLVHPIYSATRGVWDAFYSSFWLDGTLSGCISPMPPWNYAPMAACAWFAIPVSVAMVAGMLMPLEGPARRAQIFSAGVFLLFMAAMLALYLKLPIYSTAKATYTLGLTPIYGMFAAAGVRPLLANVYARGVVHGLFVCLGACAYASYFVVSSAP